MDLARLSIKPRLRNGWEAIDLGFAMSRQWWWPAFIVWLLPAAALYALFAILLPTYPGVSLALVWWCKPLWDRLPLMLASRALFGETLDAKATLRGSWQTFKRDCVAALSWRRFSPSRSFDMPVTILEGLRGADRSRRQAVLHQSYGNAAVWLTLVLMHVEFFLVLGIWAAVALMIPTEFQVDWFGLYLSESTAAVHLRNGVTLLVMALVGPFYSICGFALYICRRIQLEGWDIEIRFRHLLNRRESPTASGSKAAAAVLALGLAASGAFFSPQLQAEKGAAEPDFVLRYYEGLQQHPAASDAKQAVTEVMSGEDFHRIEVQSGWRFKQNEASGEADFEGMLRFLEFFEWLDELLKPIEGLFFGVANGVELIGWLLLIAVVGFLLYRYRKGLLSMLGRVRLPEKDRPPELLFGLDLRQESLPEDIHSEVMNLWQAGRQREALALLYRASLSRLVHQHGFEFSVGYTEQECVSLVCERAAPALSDFMARLTRSWQLMAYGHRPPSAAELKNLCENWQALFQEAARHAA